MDLWIVLLTGRSPWSPPCLIIDIFCSLSGSPPEVKGLVWYTDGSKMKEGTGAGVYGQSVKIRLNFSLGRHTTVFQAEIYAILACVYKIQSYTGSEKYISICSDSQAALKALQAVRTTSPLVHQCQEG
jgi:hypothetical protein